MKKIVFLLLLTGATTIGFAQSARTDSVPAFVKAIGSAGSWLTAHKFALRQTLDGSKSEAKPASFLWNNDYENKLHYITIDMGVKLAELPLLQNVRHVSLVFYPKFEWHKNSSSDAAKTKNNLTGGINTEFIYSFGEHWYEHPFLTGSFDYKNDLVKQLETTQTKGFLSFSGSKGSEPGGQAKNSTHALVFRYYPYSGLEYYKSINKGSLSATYWANRFYMEFYPLSKYQYQFVQFTLDYTHRRVIKDNLYNQGNLDWLSAGFNIYPDGKGSIGIGLTYSKGEDPSSNFVKTDMLALGLKLKI
jgi:hypothetical protein